MLITYHPRKQAAKQVAIFLSLEEYSGLLEECKSLHRRTLPTHTTLLGGLLDVEKLIKEKG